MITINYFSTSIQRFYRLGTTGDWINYQDQPIKVNQGQTIYAKGIDQYGNETRIVSSYTVNVPDAIGAAAYDGNDSTSVNQNNVYMKVDSSMEGKKIIVKWTNIYSGSRGPSSYITFLDKNKNVINQIKRGEFDYSVATTTIDLPVGTGWINYSKDYGSSLLYEITPVVT